MTFPQPAPPGFPPPGYPPYGYPPPAPSAATAMIAAALALIGALYNCMPLLGGLYTWKTRPRIDNPLFTGLPIRADTAVVLWIAAHALQVTLLAAGSIMLFRRKSIGRSSVIVGCLVALLTTAAPLISDTVVHHRNSSLFDHAALMLTALPVLATLILAFVPSTTRWLATRTPHHQY